MYAVVLIAAALIYMYGDKVDAWIVLTVVGLWMGVDYLNG